VIRVGVEILSLVGEVFDYSDASHHEDDILLTDHLELIEDRCRVYSESSIEADLEAVCQVLLLVVLSDLGILVLNCFDDLEVFLCFHSYRNHTILNNKINSIPFCQEKCSKVKNKVVLKN